MSSHDVVIVGARAAGAATAMLLARGGANVLVLDRDEYGSDTLSTHALMRTAVLQLGRWGLLDALRASDTPAIRRVTFEYPDERLSVEIKPADGVDALFAPRRTLLDRILVDAAREAGARVEFGVSVRGVRTEGRRVAGVDAKRKDGSEFTVRAPLVIGADGIRSVIARDVGARTIREAEAEGAIVYGYFAGVEASGYEWIYGCGASAGVIPTNGGEVCAFVGGDTRRVRSEVRGDLPGGFLRMASGISQSLAARLAAGRVTGRFRAFSGIRGFYREPFGPGWALVGDAGFFRDPITTHGISDAFRDAELLARAILGLSTFGEYARLREELTRDLFAVTERIARYDWSPREVRRHLLEVSRAMKGEVEYLKNLEPISMLEGVRP